MLVARLQSRFGRKRSFQIGLVVGACSAALCAYAAATQNFWLLVVATVVAGFYAANASLYRFAGPELVAPALRERAISLVLAGGIVGAFVGPNLASATRCVAAGALRRRVPVAGRRRAAVAGRALVDPLRRHMRRRARRRASGRPLARDCTPAGVHRRRRGVGARLRRDEPADGRDADRDGAVQAPVRERGARARMARARHVRAELLHRPPDPPLRRVADHGRRRAAQLCLRRGGAERRGPDAVPGGAVPARRGLELPLHRRDDAVHGAPTGRRRRTRRRARWTSASSRRWRRVRSPPAR